MVPSLRPALLGRPDARSGRRFDLLLVVTAGLVSFLGYAGDVVAVSGGVVVLPGAATVIGVVAAAVAGYRRAGLVVGWLAAFAPLFAFNAEWGLLGLSGHTIPGRLAFVFDPVTLSVLAVAAVVAGTAGYFAGEFLRWDVEYLWGEGA
ncbi:hypothetical protein [Halomarina ordinaria]|uniref:Uncharacterized protein n=1 Tax=Halomarina ordinaria TaxID=3033939 RepID=A0ABD5U675_9EURY|nr:hypothetical protein [Halomarina sp. PSRA2]